jgi:RHS repeat-associated protein
MVAIDEKSMPGSEASRRRTQPTVDNLYQGMTMDAVTGQYYERNRDYSPSLGRWMEQDPAQFINGANTYQFVNSSPVGNVDAQGLMCRCISRALRALALSNRWAFQEYLNGLSQFANADNQLALAHLGQSLRAFGESNLVAAGAGEIVAAPADAVDAANSADAAIAAQQAAAAASDYSALSESTALQDLATTAADQIASSDRIAGYVTLTRAVGIPAAESAALYLTGFGPNFEASAVDGLTSTLSGRLSDLAQAASLAASIIDTLASSVSPNSLTGSGREFGLLAKQLRLNESRFLAAASRCNCGCRRK